MINLVHKIQLNLTINLKECISNMYNIYYQFNIFLYFVIYIINYCHLKINITMSKTKM